MASVCKEPESNSLNLISLFCIDGIWNNIWAEDYLTGKWYRLITVRKNSKEYLGKN